MDGYAEETGGVTVGLDDEPRLTRPSMVAVPESEAQYVASRETVLKWRQSVVQNQQWRRDSAKAVEYWDGNQLNAELLEKFRQRSLPPIIHNCVKRWINSVVGMQERNMTDGIVRVEDNRYAAYGEAISQKLKEAERLSLADRACLDAFGCMIKGGIGWVEVGDPRDPFDYEHRVESMPWREMFWDQSATRSDLLDSDWFRRIKYYKKKDVIAAFPDQRQTIDLCGTDADAVTWYEGESLERDLYGQRDPSRWWNYGSPEQQVCVSEFRYRVWVNGYVVDMPSGPVIFDEKDQRHMQAYQMGQVQPRPTRYRRVRQAFWIGPNCLLDRWNPVAGNEVGWVPFICYQEERTGAVYGLIRDMLSLQDEINSTKAKAHWGMDSSLLVMTEGGVVNADQAVNEVNRRDGVIILDGKVPNNRFEIDRHKGITEQNVQMYNDAVAKIGYVHGLEAPFAGSTQSRDQSGIAMQTQVDQSVTCLGAPLAHYRAGRTRVLDLVLTRIETKLGPQEMSYRAHDGSQQKVAVNIPVQLDDGTVEMLTPMQIRKQLVLDETPSTPTYRHQQFLGIVDMLRAVPEDAQKLLIPGMFEMSDLPNRQLYADMARKQLGLGGSQSQTPEEAEAEKKAKATQDAQVMLEMRGAAAKIAKDEAAAAVDQADAAKVAAETKAVMLDLQKTVVEMQKMMAEIAKLKKETAVMTAEPAAAPLGQPAKKPDEFRRMYN